MKFIFATTEIRKVPVTVLSRCQRFDLRRITPEVMIDHLAAIAAREGAAVEADALALIARAAEGSVRDALSLLDQAIATAAGGLGGRGAGPSDAGAGGPGPRARPVRGGDARRREGRAGRAGRPARRRRRADGRAARAGRGHALGVRGEGLARDGGRPDAGRGGAGAGPRLRRPPARPVAHARVADAPEGAGGGGRRAGAAHGRRDGGDPLDARGRPAVARRADPQAPGHARRARVGSGRRARAARRAVARSVRRPVLRPTSRPVLRPRRARHADRGGRDGRRAERDAPRRWPGSRPSRRCWT